MPRFLAATTEPRAKRLWFGRQSPESCGASSSTTMTSSDGSTATPRARHRQRGRGEIRNGKWTHLNNHDVLLMPDTWEYPWYASWDLSFHCVVLAHADPWFAKQQLLLLLREWYMHPNGQLPAYEWNFSDVNPPVHAWAALRVFEVSGGTDYDFLERAFHKLLLNFTWWVNQEDHDGNNLFQGGFLGLDNIGPFDRSKLSPDAGELEQSDGTAWMAMFCLDLLDMALVLATHDPTYEDVATKFFEHFAHIATAAQQQGLWDDVDGFFYDQLRLPDGAAAADPRSLTRRVDRGVRSQPRVELGAGFVAGLRNPAQVVHRRIDRC